MQSAQQERQPDLIESQPMRLSLREIHGYAVGAEDRDLGKICDTYFDEKSWIVQYFVVDTSRWLPGRKVLISPASFGHPDWGRRVVPTNLTSEKVKNSPEADLVHPISEELTVAMSRHYGWPVRWTGAVEAGFAIPVPEEQYPDPGNLSSEPGSSGLRSAREVSGYRIHALDGEIGHVEDFVVEESSWVIRYLVIDTRNWLPGGRKVLITPSWVANIDWGGHLVTVDLGQDAIRNSPEYDPSQPINRAYELQLYDYYGRPRYWEEKERR